MVVSPPKADRSGLERGQEERNRSQQVEATLLRILAVKRSKEMECLLAGGVGS